MNETELIQRTKQFALRVIRVVGALPRNIEGRSIASQLMRAGTSVGANYRAACKGRSKAEFVAKLGIVEEESDECILWLEIIVESKLLPENRIDPLLKEAKEITAIVAASRRTVLRRVQSQIAIRKSQIKAAVHD